MYLHSLWQCSRKRVKQLKKREKSFLKPAEIRKIRTLEHWSVEIETSNLVDRLIVASASPWMANYLKGMWSGHVNHLNFGGQQPYLRNR